MKKENKNSNSAKVGSRSMSEFERLRNLFPELPAAYSIDVEKKISLANIYTDKEEFHSQYSTEVRMDLGSKSSQDSRSRNDNCQMYDFDDRDGSRIREKEVEKEIEKEVEVHNSLRIGYPELWLGCLKTLVSLTHNCAAASDILMQCSTGIGKGVGNGNGTGRGVERSADRGTSASKSRGSSNSNSNSHTNSHHTDTDTDIRGGAVGIGSEVCQNNVMSVCCAALSLCISRRNAAEERTRISSTYSERTVSTAPRMGGVGPEKGVRPSLGGTLSPGETAEEVRSRTQYICCPANKWNEF